MNAAILNTPGYPLMEPIMLARAAHLLLFAEIAHEIGTPVARELRRARLPTLLQDRPDSYIAVRQAMHFIRGIERREGIDDIGFRAAQRVTCSRLSPHCADLLGGASTLYDLFAKFAKLVPLENTNVRASIRRDGQYFRIGIDLLGPVDRDDLRYSEWIQVMVATKLIREVQGPAWCPAEISFKSCFVPCRESYRAFPETPILVGQESTSILVPAMLMSEPLDGMPARSPAHGAVTEGPEQPLGNRLDFGRSLMIALRSYLPEGYPDLALAAEIAGTSVRTLQRRLMLLGTSYSHLVQQIRFEAAVELIRDRGTRMLDVAHGVGYEDQAHFTRAFQRIAGMTPTEYRLQFGKDLSSTPPTRRFRNDDNPSRS